MQMQGMTLNSLRSTIDALHNSAFLFPVARKRGYGCMNLQNSTGNMAAAHGNNSDLFGVVLDLSNVPAYRIEELKFWLKCRGIA